MEEDSAAAPYVVLCEGQGDRIFIQKLLAYRWRVTDLSVRCTHTGTDPRCAGKSGLKNTLFALDAVRSTTPGAVRGIAIVFDGDADEESRFKEIITALKDSKLGYPRPTKLREVVKAKDMPSIAVDLLPLHLDELLFASLKESHADLVKPVEDFESATKNRTSDWSQGALSKMRLRALLAASFKDDPSASLAFILGARKCPVNFDHARFDSLMNFFTAFRNEA